MIGLYIQHELSYVTVGYQAEKAALSNPVKNLRTE